MPKSNGVYSPRSTALRGPESSEVPGGNLAFTVVRRLCGALVLELVKPRFHNKQVLHHKAILIPPQHNVSIFPDYIAHGISNGANAFILHSEPNALSLTTAQPGTSGV